MFFTYYINCGKNKVKFLSKFIQIYFKTNKYLENGGFEHTSV